jgi:hypothetical protein
VNARFSLRAGVAAQFASLSFAAAQLFIVNNAISATCVVSGGPQTLFATKTGAGTGSVSSSPAGISCGATCSATFAQNTAVTLTAAPSANVRFVGWSGSCSGTATTAQVVLTATSTCYAEFAPAAPPPTPGALYVATTGSDTTGDGSLAKPWKTISAGISRLPAGGTLIVRNGVYVGKANFITGLKAGTAASRTTVMAETPMEVRIQNGGVLNYYDYMLNMNVNYVKVDGFIFDMAATNSPEYSGSIEGSFNTLSRSIFKRAGDIDKFGGLLYVGGNDNLVEDVAGVGACRYCFSAGGPDAATQRNIYRRLVGRFDYSNSAQPKATFSTYGNNSNTNVRDHLYQNVIAIDGQNPGNMGGEEKYGGFYMPKLATNVRLQGSMVLNEGVGHSGIFILEFNSVSFAENSIVWDLKGSSSWATGIKANTANYMTIGGVIPGAATDTINPTVGSLLKPATKPANLLSNTTGAKMVKRYGVSGTRWGEPGFDQLTTEDLWPWPYEAKIKEVFGEANAVPGGNSPATNNTKRGFAADGVGLYGGPITLTSYIWEYLGTPCPSTVCR